MDNAMPTQEWVRFIGSEYLESFIKEGGASVKFAVMDENGIPDLASDLAVESERLGYAFARINAVDTRVHMPQDIFYAISQHVNWRGLARQVIVNLAHQTDYGNVEDIAPQDESNIYDAIGAANGVDAAAVLQELRALCNCIRLYMTPI